MMIARNFILLYKTLFLAVMVASVYMLIRGVYIVPHFSSDVKIIGLSLMIFAIVFNAYNFYYNSYKGYWKYFLISIFFVMSSACIFVAAQSVASYRWFIFLFFVFNAFAFFAGASLLLDTLKNPPPIDFFDRYAQKKRASKRSG